MTGGGRLLASRPPASHVERGAIAEKPTRRTVQPLDIDTIVASAKKTNRVVVVHEAVRSFGVGAEVSSRIHENLFKELKAPVQRVASSDSPVPYAPVLEQAFLYSHADIEAAVRRTLA